MHVIALEQIGAERLNLLAPILDHARRNEPVQDLVATLADLHAQVREWDADVVMLHRLDPALGIRSTVSISVPSMSKITAPVIGTSCSE